MTRVVWHSRYALLERVREIAHMSAFEDEEEEVN